MSKFEQEFQDEINTITCQHDWYIHCVNDKFFAVLDTSPDLGSDGVRLFRTDNYY